MEIVDYDIVGRGVAKKDGKVYFVKNALLGEDVDIKIESEGKNFCNAVATKINIPSAQRQKPECKYYGVCGGCQLQHFSVKEQLLFKKQLVQNTLKKVGSLQCKVEDVVASNKQYFYRNKCAFASQTQNKRTLFGMYKPKTKDFVEIKKCLLASEGINNVLSLSAKFFATHCEPNLKELVIRQVGDSFLIILAQKGKLTSLDEFQKYLSQHGIRYGLFSNHNLSDDEILSSNNIYVAGEKWLLLNEFSTEQKLFAGSFLQVNSYVKNLLYQQVLQLTNSNEQIVDAYCGIGQMTYLLSQKAEKVIGIESVSSAISSANELKEKTNSKNLEFVLGDVKQKLSSALKGLKNPVVVLDPPRKGCERQVLEILGKSRVKKIIYVSCSPISLSRDLAYLSGYGFKITLAQPFDMFPNTANVETVVQITR